MHSKNITHSSIRFVMTFVLFIMVASTGAALSDELSSNIMRRVNAANEYLDKAEEQIKSGRAEMAPRKLKSARTEYDNIFQYYGGSFDPEHPTLKSLKKRIDQIETQLSAPAPTSAFKTESVPKGQVELSANIRRRIDSADRQLEWVNKSIAKGTDDPGALQSAKNEYDHIFEYYKGSFDPNHPDLVALKGRIDAAEKASNQAVATTNQSAPLEQNHRAVDDLPSPMGKDLIGVANSLFPLENRLETANSSQNPGSYLQGLNMDLTALEEKFSKFNTTYEGQLPAGHPSYIQVQNRVQANQDAVASLEGQVQAGQQAQQAALMGAFAADVDRIHNTYAEKGPSSNLHKNNVGRMVWCDKEIQYGDQDNIKPTNKFKLTDPIFGRIYIAHSLGNTAIYRQNGDSKPSENTAFGYEFKLFIDGEEKAHKFGVFASGNFNGEAGETWTTWQFAPNPIPYGESYGDEAEAWRKTTQGLSAGTHDVRFELWAVQGSYRSAEAISVGEFALEVGQGDRVASGVKFPKDSYGGSDLKKIREGMKKALVGPVAKSSDEILKVAVTSDWKTGVYSDSKRRYKTISGTILWHDKDGDGYCRFTTYNFVSNHSGGDNWDALEYKSFCNGCPEGDVESP